MAHWLDPLGPGRRDPGWSVLQVHHVRLQRITAKRPRPIRDYGCCSCSKTTSELVCCRITAKVAPSREMEKSAMTSELNFVIWWPGDPSSGCTHKFPTPFSLIG